MACEYFKKSHLHIIIGTPQLEWKNLFGLEPGTSVTEIGKTGRNGKQTSSHRVDTFTPYVVYGGVHHYDGKDWACFLLPEGGLTKDEEPVKESAWVAYIIQWETSELLSTWYSGAGGNIRIYEGAFKLFSKKG